MDKKDKIFGVMLVLLGAALMLAPTVIAPACPPMEDGKFMKCHWMGQVIIGIGGVEALLGIIAAFVKNRGAVLGISISSLLIGVLGILVATVLIGGCMKPMMICNVQTKPAIILISGLIIVLNLFYIVKNRKELC